MTLNRLTNWQLEILTERTSLHASQAWERMNATRTCIFIDRYLVERAQLRDRVFNRADDLLYWRYSQ